MKKITTLALIAGTGLIVHCATPKELVDARQSYERMNSGKAAQLAPEDAKKAQKAMDEAEKAYSRNPNSHQTLALAYVAQRKAQLAEVKANSAMSGKKTQQAGKDYQSAQAELLARLSKLGTVKEETRGLVLTISGSVLFAFGKATLLSEAQTRLNHVAEAVLATKNRRLIVEGHTDSIGSNESNLDLSRRRAESVRSYLISRGYPEGLIEARGIGEDRPVADNSTPSGQANNRRVEIIVVPEGK